MELWHPSYELTDPSMVDPDQPISDDPLCDGLKLWLINLPLTRGGTTWFDLCNRNHGTLTNMDPATDWRGPSGRIGGHGAISIPGSGFEIIQTGTVPHGIGTGPFTAAAWAYSRDQTTSRYRNICANAGFAPGFIYTRFTGLDQWGMYDGGNRSSGNTLAANRWYHLLVTRSGTTVTFYQDGLPTASTATSGTNIANGVFSIGNTGSAVFNGLIDDVMLYTRSFSAADAMALYQDSRLSHPRMLNWQRRTITRFFGGASFTATAALTTAAATMAASATFAPGTKTATAALTLGAATMAAAATFDAGTFTATAALTTAAATMAAAATFAVDSFQATAALTTAAATMTASATFAPGTFTATATLSTAAATMAASATFDSGTFTATAALAIPAATMNAAATSEDPLYQATAALVTAALSCVAAATFSESGAEPAPAAGRARAIGGGSGGARAIAGGSGAARAIAGASGASKPISGAT